MAGRLQKSYAGVCGPLVTKKVRNRVKSSKASDGHLLQLPAKGHSKSQESVKSDCRIQPYRAPGNLNTTTSFSTKSSGHRFFKVIVVLKLSSRFFFKKTGF